MPAWAARHRSAALLLSVAACGGGQQADRGADAATRSSALAAQAVQAAIARIEARADAIDDALQPIPLLTPSEEADLRRATNAQHRARARALGVSFSDSSELRRLEQDGRLVRLEDATDQWVVRDLEHSLPLVTPGTRSMLSEIAERFQARLGRIGLPGYRLEVTSVLRTPALQADLRATNPNAAANRSAHEHGTTLDVAYSSFAAPSGSSIEIDTADAAWLAPILGRLEVAVLEQVAARRSRELQAILGHTLRELQSEGALLVTMERQQPVYHVTVARATGPR